METIELGERQLLMHSGTPGERESGTEKRKTKKNKKRILKTCGHMDEEKQHKKREKTLIIKDVDTGCIC